MDKHDNNDKTIFGFWVYLMTDLVMFAALFATFAVLRNNTFGGPQAGELFSLPFALFETLILLTSSFTCGLGILSARSGNKNKTILLFAITFVLGGISCDGAFRVFTFDIGGKRFSKKRFFIVFFYTCRDSRTAHCGGSGLDGNSYCQDTQAGLNR